MALPRVLPVWLGNAALTREPQPSFHLATVSENRYPMGRPFSLPVWLGNAFLMRVPHALRHSDTAELNL